MKNPPLRQIFYVSRCTAAPEQVEDILAVSRSRNAGRGITGALLFSGGFFAQVLEGNASALQLAMASIEADTRHEALKRLLECDLAVRRFAGWSMAYAELPGVDELLAHLVAAPGRDAGRAERLVERMFTAASDH